MLVDEATAGKPNVFITLTSNPAVEGSADLRAQLLVEAWRKVVRRAKAKYKLKTFQYLAVFEQTKKGEPHLHILCRMKWIDQAWLSQQMKELNGAPIVWVERIRSKRKVANYCAKYCGKDPKSFRRCKRYWRTMDYMHPTRAEIKASRPDNEVYYFAPMSFADYKEAMFNAGMGIDKDFPQVASGIVMPWETGPPCVPPNIARRDVRSEKPKA